MASDSVLIEPATAEVLDEVFAIEQGLLLCPLDAQNVGSRVVR
jgi:hypothetical protein